MAFLNQETDCCGLMELADIAGDTPEEALEAFLSHCHQRDWYYNKPLGWQDPPGAHVIFTEARYKGHPRDYGRKLKAFLIKQRLGPVIETGWKVNPNHNTKGEEHWIKTFVWTPNRQRLLKFLKSRASEGGDS